MVEYWMTIICFTDLEFSIYVYNLKVKHFIIRFELQYNIIYYSI